MSLNNILSFNEYSGQELERVVYDNELNEKNMLRGFFNKRAARKVKSELAEEIEMSKTIMEGIQSGLESLNENFDAIKKDIESDKSGKKGEKEKVLDSIKKIIEDSRNNTWDLNQLIDEGEIDYTGFTANVGIASVAYFGILFTPFRSIVMIHKGYNYFFNIVKNTIRKALVMLQLNFDQFENLIITKGFQSAGYLQDQDTSVKISEFYGKLQSKLFDEKSGSLVGKKGSAYAKEQMQLAKQQIDAMMKADKIRNLSDNAYNCLDQYNNTYTRSLETLRQYSQEDVQKHLDSIKTSMSKLAGQEADLQVFSELIIAAAEEHAYKVSSSIYNKFAKMTEVFSLPNQQKLIDLIQAATKEKQDAAEEEKKKRERADELKKANEFEDEGAGIFSSLDGVKLGKMNDETKKYDEKDIEAGNWTYDEFNKLDDDKKQTLDRWLNGHPEVLKKCDDTLQIALKPDNYYEYVDMLIDYVGSCLVDTNLKKKNESYILDFGQYLMESEMEETPDKGESREDGEDESEEKETAKKSIYVIDFNKLEDSQLEDVKKMFIKDDEKEKATVSRIALEVIGKKLLNDNTFVKNAEQIVKHISDAADSNNHKVAISSVTYELLKKSIDKLKYLRSHDYSTIGQEQNEKSEK